MKPDTDAVIRGTRPDSLVDHNLVPESETIVPGILYERHPAKRPDGSIADGLFNAWWMKDWRGGCRNR